MKPPHPKGLSLIGDHVRVEPLDSNKHSKQLFTANMEPGGDEIWHYLPYGPFDTEQVYQQWLYKIQSEADQYNRYTWMMHKGDLYLRLVKPDPVFRGLRDYEDIMKIELGWTYEMVNDKKSYAHGRSWYMREKLLSGEQYKEMGLLKNGSYQGYVLEVGHMDSYGAEKRMGIEYSLDPFA